MSEKLKQQYLDWGQLQPNSQFQDDRELYGLGYAVLAAAERGEFPGFQLVPVELSKSQRHTLFVNLALHDDEQQFWTALLTAYEKDQS